MNYTHPLESLKKHLHEEISGRFLGVFRMVVGAALLWEALYFYKLDFIENFLLAPEVHFPFRFTAWLPIFPKSLLEIMLLGMVVSALLIILGVFTRIASILYACCFGYFFLVDKSIYNNHLYLLLLLLFLFSIIPVPKFSLLNSSRKKSLRWHSLVFQLQIALVYFFGGISKLNPDWLYLQQPVRIILEKKALETGAMILNTDFLVYLLTYGGILVDLLLPFLLFHRKTWKIGLGIGLIFNSSNAILFDDINIFPYLMMGALVLFIPEKSLSTPKNLSVPKRARTSIIIILLFFSLQLVLPLRHFLYKGRTDWTMNGQYFSWRMKIQHKHVKELSFKLWDNDTKTIYPVDLSTFRLSVDQLQLLGQDPQAAVTFARYLSTTAQHQLNIKNPKVTAEIWVGFNGRKPQLVFPKDLDLMKITYHELYTGQAIKPLLQHLE